MNNKRILFIPLLIASVFILSACQVFPWFGVVRGSGEMISEIRPVSGFNAIRLDGFGRVVITQGASESLEIRADDNLIDDLTSRVTGNTLELGFQNQPWRRTVLPSQPVVYNLVVTELTKLTINGAGDIEIQSLEAENLVLEINGAGNLRIDSLLAESLSVNLAGTGSINISGVVTTQAVSLDGAGNYQAGNLQTQSTSIDINGLGNGTVWTTETLTIAIDGAGSVSYYGAPQVSQSISGLGDVRNLGEK